MTLIASDIGKLRPKLVERSSGTGIWQESSSPAFSSVLRNPNRFQNHIQFKESWTISKLTWGNTYVLKERDGRGVVSALYILDPSRVTPLVSDSGDVYYQLNQDNLAGVEQAQVIVPASEIIHDRMNCLYHPLVGIPPLYASSLAAQQGLAIQKQGTSFFQNGSRPSGILTAPKAIGDDQADAIKAKWKAMYGGPNQGDIAVLGGELSYQPIAVNSSDAQLVEQLELTAQQVCSAFRVPAFKIGVGTMPTFQNGVVLNQIYYDNCLQSHIEQFELCMDGGLGIGEGVPVAGRELGVELDLDGLLRMDMATQLDTLGKGVTGGVMAPNEARRKIDLPPVKGGETPYLQQQNYSLAELAARASQPAPQPSPQPSDEDVEDAASKSVRDWGLEFDSIGRSDDDFLNSLLQGATNES